ncbi:hypothetical protein BT67DRAFT_413696 [Trichocladium antarcticum]|uniref:Mediator of RNA polymerase II transcription subunit 1 n=1 Tax=Trichocladium antarcticum TaxID=1450529 RepID=A0AAN6UW12_9PEZI|nr:hypothetical protein BT67DRAFT_413696 [Trichocladium antarcticum]
MSTPTPGKHPLSQGKTPSQAQHGATATPPVSTPFSVTHAAFSPNGPRSSPQQVRKSPATATTGTLGRAGVPVNFDSPSAAAALGALQLGNGLDIGLPHLAGLGKASEDEKARRLDGVIDILSRSRGLVSEAGLERLAKKLELEFMWESSMGGSEKKTLIVAGSALELVVEFSNNVVQSVALSFPDSAEIVNKHAETAGGILFKDLQLGEGQSPLTKSLDSFAANFERLAVLDKLSINPGLNLYEAVAGIYESLTRLHLWELQKAREDPALAGNSEELLENIVLSTKSGKPTMNAGGRVGMTLDYWKERRLQPLPGPDMADWAAENEQTWSIFIGCAPQREIGVNPVRISDKWIGASVEKAAPLPDELHAGGPIIDWLEPESTFVPVSDQAKADPMQAGPPLLGPRLPEVVFHATFNPPVHIPLDLWNQIQELGCVIEETELRLFDNLVIPHPPGTESDPGEMRTINCTKKTLFAAPDDARLSLKTHANTLYVYKPAVSRTLTQMTFSHPQQLVSMLPYLRQYAFLAQLLENSFKATPAEKKKNNNNNTPNTPNHPPSSSTQAVTTAQDAFESFLAEVAAASPDGDGDPAPLAIDTTLTLLSVPRLRVLFPFGTRTASVTVEIQENGRVHVEAQNVLDARNTVAPSGRPRAVGDVGRLLETVEDVGKWVEFMRSRWA